MGSNSFRYRAFISYSHADEKWARWLHRSLETYRIPKHLVGQSTPLGPVPEKLAPVFRDRDELASATDLGSKLTEALEGAASLIVICSRTSAKSHWVNEEVLAYKRLGRADRVFSLIVDGEPYSSGIPGEEERECFPEALRFHLGDDGHLSRQPAEPIAADARPGKDGKANARIKLIAGILGVGFDDLRQRELQRRNRRLALISTSAVAGMLVAIGLATTAIIARNEAEQQRARAETEAETARQTASFMIDLFDVSDPGEARGRSITAREILIRGADRIRTELAGQPRIQTSLMDTIGKVYTSLGLYDDAGDLLGEAVSLRRKLPELPVRDFADTLYNLANVLTEQAHYERAAALYQEALEALAQTSQNTGLRIDINAALAELHFRTGDYASAEPVLRQVLADRLQLHGETSPEVAEAIEEIGLNQFDQGHLQTAESRLREALQLRWKSLGRAPHPDIAENLNNLALVLMTAGQLEPAESLYTEALEMNRRLYGKAHPAIALSLSNLAEIHRSQGKLQQSAADYRAALAMQRELLGESHPEVARLMNNLAFIHHDSGDLTQAMALSTRALAMQRETLGERHPNIAASMAVLGRWHRESGSLVQAEAQLREALAMQVSLLEPDHPDTAITRLDLAETLLSRGNDKEALALAQAAEASLNRSLSSDHWITALAQQVHGATLLALGQSHEAITLLEQSQHRLRGDPGAKPDYVRQGEQRLASAHRQLAGDRSARPVVGETLRHNGP